MTPDQLTRYLETRGLADTDGIARKARFRRCAWCGVVTLQGLDADVAGLPTVCDVTDLDPLAEAAVVLAGERTYEIAELPDGLRIIPRHVTHLRAAQQPRPVVARHICERPMPTSTANRWKAATHDPSLHRTAPPF